MVGKGAFFTYSLTAFGTLGGLFNPFFGFLVYVAFSILRPESMWFWDVPQAQYSRSIALCMLVGWAAHGFGDWQFRRGGAVVAALLAYWFWMIASAAQAADTTPAWELVIFFAKVVLPFLVGATMMTSLQHVKQLAWVIVVCQGYLAFELNLAYYSGYNRVQLEGFGGMDNNCVAIAMVTGVGLAFFLGMGTKTWWHAAVAFLCAGLMAHVIMFSFSRGGMFALALTGLVSFILIPKQPKHYLLFIVALALAIRLAGPQVQERFSSAFSSTEDGVREASAQSRLVLWRDALDATLSRPVLGLGPDNWGLIAAEYGWPRGKEVHSLWVQNAAEVGIPGVAFLLLFFGLCVVRLWPLTSEQTPTTDPWMREAARMVIAALVGFVIAAQFVTIKYLEVPYYIALIGVGVLRFNVGEQTPALPTVAMVPIFRPRVRKRALPW